METPACSRGFEFSFSDNADWLLEHCNYNIAFMQVIYPCWHRNYFDLMHCILSLQSFPVDLCFSYNLWSVWNHIRRWDTTKFNIWLLLQYSLSSWLNIRCHLSAWPKLVEWLKSGPGPEHHISHCLAKNITLQLPLSLLWLKPVVTLQKRQQEFYIFQTWCTIQLSIFAVDLIKFVDHLVSINTCTAHFMSQYY